MQCSIENQQEDPFYFDRDGLEQVASIQVVNDGLSFAQGGDVPGDLATGLVNDVTFFCDGVRSRGAGYSIE